MEFITIRMTWNILPAADFARFEREWDALNAKGPDTPLLDRDFMVPLIETFATGKERLAIFGDPPSAMAIVTRARALAWETFQPSQAPVGAWVADRSLAWGDLLPRLQRALPACALLGVNQIDPEHFVRPGDGVKLATLNYIDTARITVDKTFDEYWKARGKNLRHNLKKQRSRLAHEGIATRLEIVSDRERVDEAVLDYAKLENAGWKAGGGTAIAPGNSQHRFYSEMLQRFAARGKARIYRYFFAERLVATDLCLHSRSMLIILKTTYAESEKSSSPALLMREEAFAKLFEEGQTQRIEFYGKVMDWHTRWSDEIRTLYHINCYRFGWLRQAHRAFADEPALSIS